MSVSILLIIAGFILLIKGADWLVNGSVSLAKHYRIPELVIGLTIVAFGTSAPELVVNIFSSIKGYSDVTIGNIVGSNLFNLLLILGFSGIIFPLTVQISTVWKEIPFSLLAIIVLFVLANFSFNSMGNPSINWIDGIILLAFFLLFMIYIYRNMRKGDQILEGDYKEIKPVISLALIVIGLISLIVGSRLVVDNAVEIARYLGISERVIAVTIVSAGTSLPELVTSVLAAFRKKSDIAIGNVIGSNIFNIFMILGISSLISPIVFNPKFNLDILLLTIATAFLFGFMFSGKKHKFDRWEAILFFIAYVGYIMYILI